MNSTVLVRANISVNGYQAGLHYEVDLNDDGVYGLIEAGYLIPVDDVDVIEEEVVEEDEDSNLVLTDDDEDASVED